MEESRRTKMTKRLMKDALLELMEDKPITKISVSAICQTADVNRSTFYAYYEEPVQLLRDVENEVFEKMPHLTDMNNVQKNKAFMKLNTKFFEYIRQNVRAFRILLVNSEDTGFQNRLIEKVLEMYVWNDDGKDENFNRFRYVFVANGAVGMLKEWIRQDFPCDAATFAKLIVEVSVG